MIPTYVTIPVRDRHEWVANLVGQLTTQIANPLDIFVFDNESNPPQPRWGRVKPIPAPGAGVFEMWNWGLDMAEGQAQADGHERWNVAVLNSDVSIPPGWLSLMADGLRSCPFTAIAYSDIYEVGYGRVMQIDNFTYAHQTFSGWAWMMAGEYGLRCDPRFSYWYGDADLEATARANGYHVVCVGGSEVEHLDAGGHVTRERHRLEQARADEARYAEKWGMDPKSLFLAQNPWFGSDAA